MRGDAVIVDRWRRLSLRARLTVLNALALAVAALVPLAIALGLISARTEDRIIEELRGIARQVAGELRQGYAPRPVPSELVDVQVVDARGQVVTASAGLAGRPPMTTVRPSRPDVPERLHLCDPPITAGECLHVVALAVDVPGEVRVTGGGTVPGGRWVVYTGTRRRHYPPPYAEVLVTATLLTVALNGWLTYRVIGRVLRPVRVIRSELAEITTTDLGRRVTVPESHGEIEQLALTVNRTLDLLEGLVEQQRRFASDASHDLRSPLTAIRAQVEEGLLAPEETDWVATARAILGSVDRLQALVTDLLLVATLEAGGAGSRDLVDLAELVRAELERRPREPRVRTRLESGVVVIGDLQRLTRVLANLLDNAERHAKSTITVTVRREPDAAVLEVLDDGPGIPPEHREVVFQRFTRLDTARSRDAGGTGLGLAIARQIAESHGGTLTIEDSLSGARFVLRLPYPENGDEEASPPPRTARG